MRGILQPADTCQSSAWRINFNLKNKKIQITSFLAVLELSTKSSQKISKFPLPYLTWIVRKNRGIMHARRDKWKFIDFLQTLDWLLSINRVLFIDPKLIFVPGAVRIKTPICKISVVNNSCASYFLEAFIPSNSWGKNKESIKWPLFANWPIEAIMSTSTQRHITL